MDRWFYADADRQEYESRAMEWHKLYTGSRHQYYVDRKQDGYEPAVSDGRSRLILPKGYELVDGLRARIVKSFTSSRPFIEYLPKPDHPDQAGIKSFTDAGDKMTAIVDDDLAHNNYELLLYQLITSALICPSGVLSVGWRTDEQKLTRRRRSMNIVRQDGKPTWDGTWTLKTVTENVTTWDGNEISVLSWYDFWRDSRGRSIDIDQDRFVFSREWMTQQEIEDQLDILNDSGSEVFPIDWAGLRDNGYGYWNRQDKHYTPDPMWTEEEAPRGYLFEVLNYHEDTKKGMLLNRTKLAAYGDTPFWHTKKPFVTATFDPMPASIYGLCGMQIIEPLARELNTQRNQRIDNVSLVMNKMWRVTPGALMDEGELYSRPHGIIHANAGDLDEVKFSDVTKSAYTEEQIVKQDMDGALGALTSMPAPKTTATQNAQTANANSIRNDIKTLLFGLMGVKRLAFLLEQNNQQFLEDSRMAKRYAVEGQNAWLKVQPIDVVGFNYEYRASGSSADPTANKELRRNQLLQLKELYSKTPSQFIDPYELDKLLVESFDIKSADKLLKPPEQQGQPGQPGPGQAQGQQPPTIPPGQGQPAQQQPTMAQGQPAPGGQPSGQIKPPQQAQPAPQAQSPGQMPGQPIAPGGGQPPQPIQPTASPGQPPAGTTPDPQQIQQLLQAVQSGQVPPEQIQTMLIQLLQKVPDPQAQQTLQAIQSGQINPEQQKQLLITILQAMMEQPQGQPQPGQPQPGQGGRVVQPVGGIGSPQAQQPSAAVGMQGRV